MADLENERDVAHTKIAALVRKSDLNAAHSAESAMHVEQLSAQHEEDVALCENLREQLSVAVASAAEAEEALSRTRGLADSANAARDDVLAELDAARSGMKTLEASSQELVEVRREYELKLKKFAEEAARERAEASTLVFVE